MIQNEDQSGSPRKWGGKGQNKRGRDNTSATVAKAQKYGSETPRKAVTLVCKEHS